MGGLYKPYTWVLGLCPLMLKISGVRDGLQDNGLTQKTKQYLGLSWGFNERRRQEAL